MSNKLIQLSLTTKNYSGSSNTTFKTKSVPFYTLKEIFNNNNYNRIHVSKSALTYLLPQLVLSSLNIKSKGVKNEK